MWGKETLELEEITVALLYFNQRKKAGDGSSQGEAPMAKGNQESGRNKSRSESSRRKDIQCYKCRKKGHIKRELPE